MPAATFSRARDIFRKPSLRKSAGHTENARQDISVPSIDATLSLLYSPQNAVFPQTDALHVTPAGEYSRYAHSRPGWGEQQCQRTAPLPADDAPGTPARRRGSAPSGSARPSRAELLGGHAPSHDEATEGDGRPQRTMTLGRRTRRADDAPRGPAALTPSPKRYAMFYDDQTPFLEAASQLFGPVPSPETAAPPCLTPPPDGPHPRRVSSDLPSDVTADADQVMDSGKLLECQHSVESAHELYFTVDVLHSSDDGDVTLVFTDYPRWL